MKTEFSLSALLLCGGLCALLGNAPVHAFTPADALYNGLFYETNGMWQQSSGTITIKSTARGTYSARIQLGTARYSFSGWLDSDGGAGKDILRHFQYPLHARFQVDSADPDLVLGSVSDGTWTSELIADRAVFDGRTSISSDAGQYTMVLLGDFESTNSPGGHSYGTIRVNRAGRIHFAGSLADGTRVSQSATVSKGGQWPFHVPLYQNKGSLYGWLLFNGSAEEDLSGDVVWIKPVLKGDWFYPDGFAVLVPAAGSRYARPPKGIAILNPANAEIQFNGGNLDRSITNHFILNSSNRITNLDANGLRLTFNLASGTFSGWVMDPIIWDWIPFRGVVLQRFGIAAGYFPGWDQTGEVWME